MDTTHAKTRAKHGAVRSVRAASVGVRRRRGRDVGVGLGDVGIGLVVLRAHSFGRHDQEMRRLHHVSRVLLLLLLFSIVVDED